ncbi:MAG: transglycosylase SLT domain-containing protein [Deltaproteobacteria bacterium]|nr:transglycosylase SLT domain-containing protein [Deltaproteobacteria bacterium]
MHEIRSLRPLALVVGIVCALFFMSLHYADAQWSAPVFSTAWAEARTIDLIAAHLENKRARIPDEELREVAKTIYDASHRYGVDYRLVLAVMEAESNFRQDVVSNMGAVGIMQVKTVVAREFSRDLGISYKKDVLDSAHANVRFGVYYLAWLSKYFDNDRAVLFAYNVGFTRARQTIQRNSEPKTSYTRKVLQEYERNRVRFPMDDATETRQSLT